MIPARQPKGIPTGGQFAADVHAEPEVALAHSKATHTAPLTGTIELSNEWFDKLPDWPEGMPEPQVNFGFDDGKVETYIESGGKMMTFRDSDHDGVINDTANGDSPWEDFDPEDQEEAEKWGREVHIRIDSATYGVMIEGSQSPGVRDIILAQALDKEPEPHTAGPDLSSEHARSHYLSEAEDRLATLKREVQQVYMIGAAQELQKACPAIDTFELAVDERGHLEIAAAWDADGNPTDGAATYAASQEVFRYRNEDDFSTFLDSQPITVADAISFRPAS